METQRPRLQGRGGEWACPPPAAFGDWRAVHGAGRHCRVAGGGACPAVKPASLVQGRSDLAPVKKPSAKPEPYTGSAVITARTGAGAGICNDHG